MSGACALHRDHEIDLALCADLEHMADLLPELPDDPKLRRLTERLQSASRRWLAGASDSRFDTIEMVARCRLIDSLHAEDVSDAIWIYWRNRDPKTAGQLGYMLRALFDGRRRAIAIERLALGCTACQSSAID